MSSQILPAAWMRLTGALAALLVVVVVGNAYEPMRAWAYTHWVFSYEHEFVKRALVGELWRQTGLPTGLQSFVVGATVVLALVLVLLAAAFLLPTLHAAPGDRRGLMRFALLALTCPATLAHAAYDVGRFDQVNLLLATAAVGLLAWGGGPVVGALAVLLLGASILVHEAAVFMFVPVVLAFWYWLRPDRPRLVVVTISAIALACLTVVVWLHGHMSTLDLSAYAQELASRHGNWVLPNSIAVLFRQSVEANVAFTFDRVLSGRYLRDHVWLLLFVLAPIFWLWREIWRVGGDELEAPARAMLLAASSGPLLLMPVGHDYYRWWAMSITNTFLVIALLVTRRPRFGAALASMLERRRNAVWAMVLVFVVVGPLGITKAFDRPIFKGGFALAMSR